MTSIGRIELSLVEITNMTDQQYSEVDQCLAFVEDHLHFRVEKAKANPVDADTFIGTYRMGASEMKAAITEASAVIVMMRLSNPTHYIIDHHRSWNVVPKRHSKIATFVSK